TKRPDRMVKVLGILFTEDTLEEADNVWFGVSAENQAEADRRIPVLLRLPVPNRWVSVEPMLGPVDLQPYLVYAACPDPGIKWVVCGCESGPGARPMETDWARALAAQCLGEGTSFMLKQMMEDGHKVSAPYLDGRQYMGMPSFFTLRPESKCSFLE
ncbi:MAG: phage Gp37/Gp68 family protein, partial [Desulfobacterales bacterium]|nr:phage Gp37/Gp68 family protein [Desulfobacterales bacterium]